MTWDEYEEEPDDVVSWDIAFDNMEGEIQQESIERAASKK
jgi:hypothetical protein